MLNSRKWLRESANMEYGKSAFRLVPLLFLGLCARPLAVRAQPGYTNHAGNVVAGWPVGLTTERVVLAQSKADPPSRGVEYPLSIFPESERRRIAADFGEPRVPAKVKRAIAGAEKAMARSRKRAEMGYCSKEECDAFCEKSEAALKNYLDRQVEAGVITPDERKALGR